MPFEDLNPNANRGVRGGKASPVTIAVHKAGAKATSDHRITIVISRALAEQGLGWSKDTPVKVQVGTAKEFGQLLLTPGDQPGHGTYVLGANKSSAAIYRIGFYEAAAGWSFKEAIPSMSATYEITGTALLLQLPEAMRKGIMPPKKERF